MRKPSQRSRRPPTDPVRIGAVGRPGRGSRSSRPRGVADLTSCCSDRKELVKLGGYVRGTLEVRPVARLCISITVVSPPKRGTTVGANREAGR
jgi:hypothetical protein